MSDSPYQAPRAESYEPQLPPGADREKVYLVAKHQRRVLQALLATIVINIAFMALGRQGPVFQLVWLVVYLPVVVFAIVSIFRLAGDLYGTVAAVFCAVLMVVPCVALIALFVVDQKATSYLRQHGVPVGFLGVDPRRIDSLEPHRGG